MKIKRYCKYILKYAFSKNKNELIAELKVEIAKKGVIKGIQSFLHQQHLLELYVKNKEVLNNSSCHATILTTLHCTYIANLIKEHLERIGKKVDVIFKQPINGYADHLHYVICPQLFHELPSVYVSFQMEQSVSSRWFDQNYFDQLENSFAIFDYSLVNIEFLQENGLYLQQIFYLPVGYFDNYLSYVEIVNNLDYEYDIVFYGDVNNSRRKEFIEYISQKFKVKVLSEVFGKDLLFELQKAKIVINIHYYEGALLETTRIYECLSLNKLVISEKSTDLQFHHELEGVVDFVEIGDKEAMLNRIEYWLVNESVLKEKISQNQEQLKQRANKFTYCFYRFLLAKGFISYTKFYEMVRAHINISGNFWCLSLPESQKRQKDFIKDNKYEIKIFDGVRHQKGWVGCGLSFKTMLNYAFDRDLDFVIICEDDVKFLPGFETRLDNILKYLMQNSTEWDLFSGLIADLNPDTNIMKIIEENSEQFVYIDKMVSTVFVIYNKSSFKKFLNWDDTYQDENMNTIDRYIENNTNMRVITTAPFLVGHKEELHSILWGFENSTYTDLINKSEQLLQTKINEHKQ